MPRLAASSTYRRARSFWGNEANFILYVDDDWRRRHLVRRELLKDDIAVALGRDSADLKRHVHSSFHPGVGTTPFDAVVTRRFRGTDDVVEATLTVREALWHIPVFWMVDRIREEDLDVARWLDVTLVPEPMTAEEWSILLRETLRGERAAAQ